MDCNVELAAPVVIMPIFDDGKILEGPADSRHPDACEEPGATGWFEILKAKIIAGLKFIWDMIVEGVKFVKDKVVEGWNTVTMRTRRVPDPGKITFQETWWGYRIYLPPAVADALNNMRLEAAKRAAIITPVLQWCLGLVPLTVVPPQFRTEFLMAQRLVPWLGYGGAFMAWSWGAMGSFEKGQGIVLTGTWLFPVAFISGTWEVNEGANPASSNAVTGASPSHSPASGASTSDFKLGPLASEVFLTIV